MRKFLCLTMAAIMALSMVACSSNEKNNEKADDTINSVVQEVIEKATAQKDDITIERSALNGNVYTNNSTNVTIEVPEGWLHFTEEELKTLVAAGAEMTDMNKNLMDMMTFADVGAMDIETGSNVIVLYENLNLSNAGTRITASEYAEAAKTQLVMQGLITEAVFTENINGVEYTVLPSYGMIEGFKYMQWQFLKPVGQYMTIITLSGVPDLGFTYDFAKGLIK